MRKAYLINAFLSIGCTTAGVFGLTGNLVAGINLGAGLILALTAAEYFRKI